MIQFTQASTEVQKQIIDTITQKEYVNDYYDCTLSYDEGIFMNAVDEMGFVRPVKRYIYGALASNEIDYKKEREALQYNLSYSQGDYAFITGDYNLNKLIEILGKKELANDLRFIHKKAWSGAWEIDFAINRDGFLIERKDAGRFEEDTNILDFISELECFQERRKIKSKIVKRAIKALSSVSGGSRFNGSTRTSKNIVEQAFYDFEYDLKKELYTDIEYQEQEAKEYWQEEVLKPQLENAVIENGSVCYQKKWTEREVFNTTEDILCYFAMQKTGCQIFSTKQNPLSENMDFQVFYDLKNGNFICEGIWNPLYKASEYLHYNKELQRVEHYVNGVLQDSILGVDFITKAGFQFENNKYIKITQITACKTYYIN